MFNSLEVRRVENGFVITVNQEGDEAQEYVFPNLKKTIVFIKGVADTEDEAARKLLKDVKS